MTTPDSDSASSFGVPLNNYAPVTDPTVDWDAGNFNRMAADVAGFSHTIGRAWVRLTGTGSSTPPAVTSHDAVWEGNNANAAPTSGRTSAGVYTSTWPAIVQDEIPANSPGSSTGHNVNLRWAIPVPQNISGAAPFFVTVTVSANVATINTFTLSGGNLTATELANNIVLDVFVG